MGHYLKGPFPLGSVHMSDLLKYNTIQCILGNSVKNMWGGVGDFFYGQLAITLDQVGQNDVEDVKQVVEVPISDVVQRQEEEGSSSG